VVEAALDDFEGRGRDPVDEAMLAVDAAGPEAGKVALERFGFAGALEWVAEGGVKDFRRRRWPNLPLQHIKSF
jgi:hypothetical protein